jgi:hypothetical protein
VFVNGVKASDTARTLGKGYRREVLDVELGLVVEVNADDALDSLQRAYRMLGDIETSIGATPSLGVDYVLFSLVTGYDQKSYVGDGKRIVEITVTVQVTTNGDPGEGEDMKAKYLGPNRGSFQMLGS